MENYKKLLEKAQKAYKNCVTGAEKRRLESIFPELKESEDEDKIMKELIYNIIVSNDNTPSSKEIFSVYGKTKKDAIAWIEKQGEQKEINLVEILKHYPRETELYSPLYGKLWLAEVDKEHEIIICYKHCLGEGCTRAILEQEDTVSFYSNGTTGLPDFSVSKDCMLFLYNNEKQGELQYWKPSKEQLEALDYAYNSCPDTERGNYYEGILRTLINDLHKLSEKQGEQKETLCDKCRKTQPSHSCQDITSLGRCALEKQSEQNPKHFELKAGHWYFCHQAYCCRADDLTVKEGERFMCEKDGVVKGFVIKEPEKYFIEISTPTDKHEPKFKVRDWVVLPNNEVKQIEEVTFGNYWFTDKTLYNIIDVDNKGHLWTIHDANDGDVLYCMTRVIDNSEIIVMYAGISNDADSYCRYSSKFGFNAYFTKVLNVEHDFITPATKEQRELLFQKMKEAGYEWDADKKELKKIDSIWSEEDKEQLDRAIYMMEQLDMTKSWDDVYNWIKSLKDRVQPKQ